MTVAEKIRNSEARAIRAEAKLDALRGYCMGRKQTARELEDAAPTSLQKVAATVQREFAERMLEFLE